MRIKFKLICNKIFWMNFWRNIYFLLRKLIHTDSVTSLWLFYLYVHGKCSHNFHYLQLGHLHTNSTEFNSSRVPNIRRQFHPVRVFSRTTALWNRFTYGCLPEHFNLDLFQSRTNHYLTLLMFTITAFIHIRHLIRHYYFH